MLLKKLEGSYYQSKRVRYSKKEYGSAFVQADREMSLGIKRSLEVRRGWTYLLCCTFFPRITYHNKAVACGELPVLSRSFVLLFFSFVAVPMRKVNQVEINDCQRSRSRAISISVSALPSSPAYPTSTSSVPPFHLFKTMDSPVHFILLLLSSILFLFLACECIFQTYSSIWFSYLPFKNVRYAGTFVK
jgi:hypothetical protein